MKPPDGLTDCLLLPTVISSACPCPCPCLFDSTLCPTCAAPPEHSISHSIIYTHIHRLTMYAPALGPPALAFRLTTAGASSSETTRTRRPSTLPTTLLVRASDPCSPQSFTAHPRHPERIKTFDPTPDRPFVLGLPTGSSPVLIYQTLVQRHKAGDISFQNVVTFNMVSLCPPFPLPAAVHLCMRRCRTPLQCLKRSSAAG